MQSSNYKVIVEGSLIGKKIKILESSNAQLKGKEGKVVDETKNILVIKEARSAKEIKIVKKQIKLSLVEDQKRRKVVVKGEELAGRPEERLKQ